MSIQYIYSKFLECKSIQIDTRKLQENAIFFCLKGENFDGNTFINEALYKGASLVISDSKEQSIQNEKVVYVENSLHTLQQLAKYHRLKLNIPVIAITGTNGKTTTKELIYRVLQKKYAVLATQGNLNNHIGIPLTLLQLNQTHEIGIIEMGASHIGEIADYCSFVLPNYGLITNIGKAHLEGFGSVENVRKGKTELFQYIANHQGTLFVNNEDIYLKEDALIANHRFSYGLASSNVIGQLLCGSPFIQLRLSVQQQTQIIDTHLTGNYNMMNVLAACAVGIHLGIALSQCTDAIREYIPENHRSQSIEKNSNTIVLDAYNANPSSMKVAIESFMQYPHTQKILLLGAMKELGQYSDEEHQKVIHLVTQYAWKKVYLVGKEFLPVPHCFSYFENVETLIEHLKKEKYQYTAFLIKGSRSITMEKVVEYL